MLLILRAVLATLFCILVCIFGSVYCLFSPRNPRHVATFGHLFGRLSTLFGIKVETRVPADAANNGNCIYIANHQNNYDMVTASNIVHENIVAVDYDPSATKVNQENRIKLMLATARENLLQNNQK